MKRRRFIALAGLGATGAFAWPSSRSVASGSGTKWQPDGTGSVARIGVLTPDFDPVPESELWAMSPSGVSIHASRVARKGVDPGSFAEPPQVDNAVELLANLRPGAILYAYTSSSYALGVEADNSLRARLEMRSQGIPVILTAPAASQALRILEVGRLALVHPPWFSEEINAKGKDYFRTRGFEVVFCARITPARSFTEVQPTEVYEWTKTNVPREAKAVFIGGNGLRAIGAIQALEEALGRPVLTANQVIFWQALRAMGITKKVTRYGRIFTKG